jgi:putative nucleotidyltransferase with HDIG domain
MKRRILFVDDEPNVLDGLRRMLRPMHREWDMQFAPGGPAALALMAAQPVDVLVTDMRMPGMDGDELLGRVRELHPRTVRMVLTGQCTREAMLRLVRLAHRVFNKPCDPEQLNAAVQKACSLQDLLHAPPLIALVSGIASLPTPPAIYSQIIAELEKADGSITEVGNLLAQDMGMSAKLMQMANSAQLGSRVSTASPGRAVQILGAETTKALVFAADVFTRYDPAALHPFSIDDLWSHSRAVAALAGRIAMAEAGKECATEASLAGLLHDIGRLVLVSQDPLAYKTVFQLVSEERRPVADAERDVFGATHAEVGAYLLGLWGLPDQLVETVAWHHVPSGCPDTTFAPLTAVHAAEVLLGGDGGTTADAAYLTRLGMGDRLDRWADIRDRGQPDGAET